MENQTNKPASQLTPDITDVKRIIAVNLIVDNIILTVYRDAVASGNEQVKQKVLKVIETLRQSENFIDNNSAIHPTLLLAPPGNGRVTLFKDAAKMAATALDMNFFRGQRYR